MLISVVEDSGGSGNGQMIGDFYHVEMRVVKWRDREREGQLS